MATIYNKTKYSISVTGLGMDRNMTVQDAAQAARANFSQAILPGETADDIPDEVAKDWMQRPGVEPFLRAGSVIVKLGNGKPKPKPRPATTVHDAPLPADPPADPPADAPSEFRGLHWKSAMAMVAEMNDLDELAALHADEDRPRVKEAIETRMKELNEGG